MGNTKIVGLALPAIPVEIRFRPVFTIVWCRRVRKRPHPAPFGRIVMETASLRSRVPWLAASFVVLTAMPWPLAAQQPAVNPSPPVQPAVPPSAQPGAGPGSPPLASPPNPAASAQPQPPPSWQQGRPEGEGAAMLAPVPALPIATA